MQHQQVIVSYNISQKKTKKYDCKTYRVLPKWGSKSELVKCEALTTCLLNPRSCSLCEPQCSHFQRRDFIHPDVISYGPNNYCNPTILVSNQ